MNEKDNNNLNNSSNNDNIKLKFNGKAANGNVDVELKLDDFKIEDLSFDIDIDNEQEDNSISSSNDSDHSTSEEMQDISDDTEENNIDGEDSNKDDHEKESSEGSQSENLDDDESNDNSDVDSEDSDKDDYEKNSNEGSQSENLDGDESNKSSDADEPEKKSNEDDQAENSDKDNKSSDENSKDSNPAEDETDKKDDNSNSKGEDANSNNDSNQKNNEEGKPDNSKKNEQNKSGNQKIEENKPGDKKPNENKPDANGDKRRANTGGENANTNRKSQPNSSRENANKNKPPKGNQQKKGNLRDRARQGLKNKAQQSFNNSRLGQTVNSAKETANKTKQTVENTKKVISFLARHPWIIAVLGVVVFAIFIIILISMLFTADASSNVICSYTEQSLGSASEDVSTLASRLVDSNTAIVLKNTTSGDFSTIKSAASLYGTESLDLSIKRYVMGVAYSEVGINVQNEAMAKAEMIAAKSFIIGRTAPGSSETMGMSFGYDQIDGKTVFYLRGNTYDQDFCDVYEGCLTGRYAKSNVTVGTGEAQNNKKGALDDASIENLSKWYDETAGELIFDDNTKTFYGTQFSGYGSYCKKGSCMSQTDAIDAAKSGSTYKEILFDLAYSNDKYTLYNASTDKISTVSKVCSDSNVSSSCGIADNDFIYYSQINEPYGSSNFCHRTDGGTIKQAGCGITAMAMVIANLADSSVTPFTTNEEAFNGGYCGNGTGTSYSYFFEAADKYNIKYTYALKSNSTDITKASNDIVNTIKKGGLVIINVNGSWLNGNSGHYVVAKGVDENDNLIIADPYAESLDTPVRNNISTKKILTDFVNNESGWFMFTSDKSNDIAEKYCSSNGSAVLEGDWFKASKYDINKVKSIGEQCSRTCFATVMAYGALINNDKTGYNKCQIPGYSAFVYGGSSHYYSSESEMFKAIVKELNKGNTVAVHGKSSINQHWVLAVGYNKNYNENTAGSMKASDILTVDPYTASEAVLSQSLSGGFNVAAYGYSNNHLIIWN